MLLHFCPVGVTLSWEEAPPGARASRPHKSSRSFGHLLHRNQPAAAPCLCFGRAHAVPAGRAVGCNIAGKLSGNRRDSMRAGRPRSRGCRPDGEVGGIRRATSLKAGLSPLGNSRLPASPVPALPCGSFQEKRPIVNPKFLTHRQDNSFIFNHHSRILGCVAWEHPDELEGPLLQRGRLGQSLDARRVRFRGQSALVAGPGPQVRHQRLQALQR